MVLPELAAHAGGQVAGALDPRVSPQELVRHLQGTDALVVTSALVDGAHLGVVCSAEGITALQPQIHDSARHGKLAKGELADGGVGVYRAPWGRLAVIVGDDALQPESFRLAALADADVVAVPFSVATGVDISLLMVERAAENRLNLVVASRPHPEHGGGALIPLSSDFTLWGEWDGPFEGVISCPTPVLARAGVTQAVLRPECAMNRFVSKGTDVVDGRPWALAEALVRS